MSLEIVGSCKGWRAADDERRCSVRLEILLTFLMDTKIAGL